MTKDRRASARARPTTRLAHTVAHSRRNTRAVAWTTAVAFVVFITIAVWATDFVTFQGEWTIYTASCQGGTWTGAVCSGSLRPGPRYRFRALKAHREVLYWTAGEYRAFGSLCGLRYRGRTPLGMSARRDCAADHHASHGPRHAFDRRHRPQPAVPSHPEMEMGGAGRRSAGGQQRVELTRRIGQVTRMPGVAPVCGSRM